MQASPAWIPPGGTLGGIIAEARQRADALMSQRADLSARARDVVGIPAFGAALRRDRVTVIDDAPRGHTRKARYIRGKTGVIEMAHGTMIYPDSAGNGGPEAPEHVYTVKFTNEELWGAEAAEPNGVVYFDVWEPYIVPAQEAAA